MVYISKVEIIFDFTIDLSNYPMQKIQKLGVVIGAGPKGISLLIELQRQLPGKFIGIESSAILNTWDSEYAGTSPTRTGMYYSDTLIGGPPIPWNLPQFAYRHPSMNKYMLARDILPKEVLQDYYRVAVNLARVKLFLRQPVVSIEYDGNKFWVSTNKLQIITKYVVIATGPANHKSYPKWAECIPSDLCQHSIGHGIFNNVTGEKLLLVGGGHATPDIACRMCELGANVTVVVRKPTLKVNFLPYPEQYIRPAHWTLYGQLSFQKKLEVLRRIHNEGPWVTPRSYQDFIHSIEASQNTTNRIEYRPGTVVLSCSMYRSQIKAVFNDGQYQCFDRVICATGFKPNVRDLPFRDPSILDGVVSEGLPHLEKDYSLCRLPNLYFTGHFAQLGPRGIVEAILLYSQYTTHIIVESIKNKEK